MVLCQAFRCMSVVGGGMFLAFFQWTTDVLNERSEGYPV